MSLQHYYNQFEQEREKVTITFVRPPPEPNAVTICGHKHDSTSAPAQMQRDGSGGGGKYGEVAFTSQQHLSKKKKKSTVTHGVHAELSTHV